MASKGGRMPESHDPGQHHFHYNREEREAMLSDETKRIMKKSKLFTMNKRNMIILADIAIILLFTMIFAPIVLGGRSSARIDGFRASLKAYEYDGTVLVSMKVETKTDNPQEAGLVSASFYIEGRDETIDTVDLLPSEAGKPRVLRAEFKSSDDDKKKAMVDLEINGTKRTLSIGVKQE